MDGWEINTPATRTVWTKTTFQEDFLPRVRAEIRDTFEDAQGVLNQGGIDGALAEVWNDGVAVNCQVTETRVDNACRALDAIIRNFVAADKRMAAEAAHANSSEAARGSALRPFNQTSVKDRL